MDGAKKRAWMALTVALVVHGLASEAIAQGVVEDDGPPAISERESLLVDYDALGRVVGVRRPSGYTLYVNYLTDGTQVIRDRAGGLISRRGDPSRGYQVLQVSDPTKRLVALVARLDELLQRTAKAASH